MKDQLCTQHYEPSYKRDLELLECYNHALQSMITCNVSEPHTRAVHFVLNYARPHYHVNIDTATRLLPKLMAKPLVTKRKLSQRAAMWNDLAKTVKNHMQQYEMELLPALMHVLQYERAERFYITPAYAFYKIQRLKAKKRIYSNLYTQ